LIELIRTYSKDTSWQIARIFKNSNNTKNSKTNEKSSNQQWHRAASGSCLRTIGPYQIEVKRMSPSRRLGMTKSAAMTTSANEK
jgi:hypothetical protein